MSNLIIKYSAEEFKNGEILIIIKKNNKLFAGSTKLNFRKKKELKRSIAKILYGCLYTIQNKKRR